MNDLFSARPSDDFDALTDDDKLAEELSALGMHTVGADDSEDEEEEVKKVKGEEELPLGEEEEKKEEEEAKTDPEDEEGDELEVLERKAAEYRAEYGADDSLVSGFEEAEV